MDTKQENNMQPLTKEQAKEIHKEYTRCQIMSRMHTTPMFWYWLKENTEKEETEIERMSKMIDDGLPV